LKKLSAACLALGLLVLAALPALAAGRPVRAAFVLLASIDDQGWTTAHHDGIQHLKKQLGNRVEVSYTENVQTPAEAERVIRGYARQGYDVIFGTTFEHMEPMYTVAGEFPKVVFMHCSGFKTRPNMGTYMVRIEQGEYLAGYLAGLMGYRNVGTVATQPIPEVVRGINAFTLGLVRGLTESGTAFDADRVNTVVWLKSWRDAVNETALAELLADSKHDLIREMADTSDSSRATCLKGVPAIGYGTASAKYSAACALPWLSAATPSVVTTYWYSAAALPGSGGRRTMSALMEWPDCRKVRGGPGRQRGGAGAGPGAPGTAVRQRWITRTSMPSRRTSARSSIMSCPRRSRERTSKYSVFTLTGAWSAANTARSTPIARAASSTVRKGERSRAETSRCASARLRPGTVACTTSALAVLRFTWVRVGRTVT